MDISTYVRSTYLPILQMRGCIRFPGTPPSKRPGAQAYLGTQPLRWSYIVGSLRISKDILFIYSFGHMHRAVSCPSYLYGAGARQTTTIHPSRDGQLCVLTSKFPTSTGGQSFSSGTLFMVG